jgi:hypothetical protein
MSGVGVASIAVLPVVSFLLFNIDAENNASPLLLGVGVFGVPVIAAAAVFGVTRVVYGSTSPPLFSRLR